MKVAILSWKKLYYEALGGYIKLCSSFILSNPLIFNAMNITVGVTLFDEIVSVLMLKCGGVATKTRFLMMD